VNRINGVDLLLSAFRLIESPEYRLAIFGRGELEGAVREAARRDGRILSGGAIPNEQVLRRQREATVLINPRPSHRLITRYTFPSKLLEYMLSGRPVITTVLPGIPGEYYEYVYPLTEETPEGLARRIRAVCSRPASELTEFGTRARRFILREKNSDMQAQRIRRFVEGL
jgi:glycosyltransferase involved in cell wall biosynthesis